MQSTVVFPLLLLVVGIFCRSAAAVQCYACTTLTGPDPGCTGPNFNPSYLGTCSVACAEASGTLTEPGGSSIKFVQRGCLDFAWSKSGQCSCSDSNIGKLDMDYTSCTTDDCNDAIRSTTSLNHSSIQHTKTSKATDTSCYICTSISEIDYDAGCEGPDLDEKYLNTCAYGCTNAIGTYTLVDGGESHKVVRRGCQPDTRVESGSCNCKDPDVVTIDFTYDTCYTHKCNGAPSLAFSSLKLMIPSLLLSLLLR